MSLYLYEYNRSTNKFFSFCTGQSTWHIVLIFTWVFILKVHFQVYLTNSSSWAAFVRKIIIVTSILYLANGCIIVKVWCKLLENRMQNTIINLSKGLPISKLLQLLHRLECRAIRTLRCIPNTNKNHITFKANAHKVRSITMLQVNSPWLGNYKYPLVLSFHLLAIDVVY